MKQDWRTKVDRLGEIKATLDALTAEDEKLRDELKKEFAKGTKVEGDRYTASIGESVRREPLPDKVLEAIGQKNFMKVVSVSVTKLDEYLSKSEIDKVVVVGTPYKTIKVTPRKR